MQTLWDFIRRTFYLSVFIIPIPIGSYTIHNGSSAMAALVSYVTLSFLIPFFYLRSSKSGFGIDKSIRIKPYVYWLGFTIVEGGTYLAFSHVELSTLWQLPTIGRDIAFIIIMYIQLLASLLVASIINKAF